MLGKSLANPRASLGRRLRATRFVVLFAVRDELEKQQGLTLSLVRPDILQNRGGFPILSDDDGTLSLFGPRDEIRRVTLERRDRFDVFGSVHDTIFSTKFSACHPD